MTNQCPHCGMMAPAIVDIQPMSEHIAECAAIEQEQTE